MTRGRAIRRPAVALALTALVLPSCALLVPTTTPATVHVSVDASHPGSPVNEGLVGTNGPGPEAAAPYLKALGLDWVRIGTSLGGNYNCSTGVWDPTSLDSQVAAAEALGATPEVDIGGTPSCLATSTPPGRSPSNDPPDLGTADQTAWDSLVYQMGYHEITTEHVKVFEVEDEPDWVYFNGTMVQYFQVYNDTVTTLEKAATAAGVTIMVGGPTLANVLDTMDTGFLDPFLAYVSANDLPLDFLSWHVYPNDPLAGPSPGLGPICLGLPTGAEGNPCYYNPNLNVNLFATEAAQAKKALASYPLLHPLLVVDEWNLDGEYDLRQNLPYDAAFAVAALTQAQSAGIDRMCLWYTEDDKPGTLGNWGMLFPDSYPKPIYYSFLFWHEMAGNTIPVTYAPAQALGDPFGSVGGIASESPGNQVSVLLYNFQPYDFSNDYGARDPTPSDRVVTLTVSGLSAGTTYSWTRDAVDASHNGTLADSGTVDVAGGSATLDFVLPGDSVSLASFVPSG